MEFHKFFHEDLIYFLDVETKDELFEYMFKNLHDGGFVKTEYLEAITAREVEYPTALQLEDLGVAIPHTDSIHVNREAIGIAILKEPITFQHMGMNEVEVNVKVIFMLAIQKPDNQLGILQVIIGMIQDKEMINAIANSTSAEQVISIIKQVSEGQ